LPFHVKQSALRQVSEELRRFHDDGSIDPVSPTSTPRSKLRSSKSLSAAEVSTDIAVQTTPSAEA
jgi:hypothetical protein